MKWWWLLLYHIEMKELSIDAVDLESFVVARVDYVVDSDLMLLLYCSLAMMSRAMSAVRM